MTDTPSLSLEQAQGCEAMASGILASVLKPTLGRTRAGWLEWSDDIKRAHTLLEMGAMLRAISKEAQS